jgi:acetyl-CoA carboxylase carboxyl transferase subunit alpha
MKMTAADLLQLGVIHRIVYEPTGGAHRNHADTIKRLAMALRSELDDLSAMDPEELRSERWTFFMQLGAF